MEESSESIDGFFAMVRRPNRFPNAGDDTDDEEMEDATEEAGLGHALATRTPGPKMRRGDACPLRLGVGTGAGTKRKRLGVGLGASRGIGWVSRIGAAAIDGLRTLMLWRRWSRKELLMNQNFLLVDGKIPVEDVEHLALHTTNVPVLEDAGTSRPMTFFIILSFRYWWQ
jgi:hypothetical protein